MFCSLFKLKYICIYVYRYVVINFLYNVFQLLVTKHGSAATMVISSALALPITNLCFSSTFLLGSEAEPFSIFDIVGLVVVLSGFLVYSFSGEKHMPAQGAGGSMVYHDVISFLLFSSSVSPFLFLFLFLSYLHVLFTTYDV